MDQFFPILPFGHWVLALFLGLGAVVATCMAFGARWHRGDRPVVDDPGIIQAKSSHLNLLSQYRRNPHGLFLALIYLGVLICMVAYYFIVGLSDHALY